MMALGSELFITNEQGEKLPLPDGEYPLETNLIAVVVDSKVAELKEKEVVEEEAPVAMDNTPTSEPAGSTSVKSEKFTQEVFYQLAQVVGAELEKFKTELRAELAIEKETTKEVVSLTKQKGEQTSEPKTEKERLLNKINQVR